MRMMVGAIVLTLLTIHFRFAHGGSKKNPNIPRGSKINRGGSSKDKSSTGNSIDDTSNSDASSTLNGTALNQTTKVQSVFRLTHEVLWFLSNESGTL